MSLSIKQKENITDTIIVLIRLMQSKETKPSSEQMFKVVKKITNSQNPVETPENWHKEIQEYILNLHKYYPEEEAEIKDLIHKLFRSHKEGILISEYMTTEVRAQIERKKQAFPSILALVDMEDFPIAFAQIGAIWNVTKDNRAEELVEKFISNIHIKQAWKKQIDIYNLFLIYWENVNAFLDLLQHLDSASEASILFLKQLNTEDDYHHFFENIQIIQEAIQGIKFLLKEDKNFSFIMSQININKKIEFIKTLNTENVKNLLHNKKITLGHMYNVTVDSNRNDPKVNVTQKWQFQQTIEIADYLSQYPASDYLESGLLRVHLEDNLDTLKKRVLSISEQIFLINKLLQEHKITKENLKNASEVELSQMLSFLQNNHPSPTVLNFILKHNSLMKTIMVMSEGERKLILNAMQCVEIRNILVAKNSLKVSDIILIWNDIAKRMSLLAALADETIYAAIQQQTNNILSSHSMYESRLKINEILAVGKLMNNPQISRLLNANLITSNDLLVRKDWDISLFVTIAKFKAMLELKELIDDPKLDKLGAMWKFPPEGIKKLRYFLEKLTSIPRFKFSVDLQYSLAEIKGNAEQIKSYVLKYQSLVADIYARIINCLSEKKFETPTWGKRENQTTNLYQNQYEKLNKIFIPTHGNYINYYALGSEYAASGADLQQSQKAFDCFIKVPEIDPCYLEALWEASNLKYACREYGESAYYCLQLQKTAQSVNEEKLFKKAKIFLKHINNHLLQSQQTRVILLDVDGTIVDSNGQYNQGLINAIKRVQQQHVNVQLILFTSYQWGENLIQKAERGLTRLAVCEKLRQDGVSIDAVLISGSNQYPEEKKKLGCYYDQVFKSVEEKIIELRDRTEIAKILNEHKEQEEQDKQFMDMNKQGRTIPNEAANDNKEHMFRHVINRFPAETTFLLIDDSAAVLAAARHLKHKEQYPLESTMTTVQAYQAGIDNEDNYVKIIERVFNRIQKNNNTQNDNNNNDHVSTGPTLFSLTTSSSSTGTMPISNLPASPLVSRKR